MILRGTEALTLEVGASLPPDAARALVHQRFELAGGRANVLFFRMTDLSIARFDYFEALWRVAIVHEGVLAWFAVKCDIDHPIVRALGARFVKYPTREARIVGSEGKWVVESAEGGATPFGRVDAKGTKLELAVRDEDKANVPELRRTFVASGDRVYEIPWNEEPPAKARSVKLTVADDALVRATFGEGAKLDETGVVHRGRVHICGFAKRV